MAVGFLIAGVLVCGALEMRERVRRKRIREAHTIILRRPHAERGALMGGAEANPQRSYTYFSKNFFPPPTTSRHL